MPVCNGSDDYSSLSAVDHPLGVKLNVAWEGGCELLYGGCLVGWLLVKVLVVVGGPFGRWLVLDLVVFMLGACLTAAPWSLGCRFGLGWLCGPCSLARWGLLCVVLSEASLA